MSNGYCLCCRAININAVNFVIARKRVGLMRVGVRASMVESHGSPNFAWRMERAWLISQQPRPVACSSCDSKGHIECKWCNGTGFFILGDNMLCQVPSRNTTCVICARKVNPKPPSGDSWISSSPLLQKPSFEPPNRNLMAMSYINVYRALRAALIAKGRGFVQSGLENLSLPSREEPSRFCVEPTNTRIS